MLPVWKLEESGSKVTVCIGAGAVTNEKTELPVDNDGCRPPEIGSGGVEVTPSPFEGRETRSGSKSLADPRRINGTRH